MELLASRINKKTDQLFLQVQGSSNLCCGYWISSTDVQFFHSKTPSPPALQHCEGRQSGESHCTVLASADIVLGPHPTPGRISDHQIFCPKDQFILLLDHWL